MKNPALIFTAFSLLTGAFTAYPAITITVTESGGNLTFITSGGSLHLDGLEYVISTTNLGAGTTTNSVWTGGAVGQVNAADWYRGAIEFAGTPITASRYGANLVTTPGDFFGVLQYTDPQRVYVPKDFTSGGLISASSITFNSFTLSSFGWVEGSSATWSWAGDSITLTTIPEPVSYGALLGFFSLGLVAVRQRRRTS